MQRIEELMRSGQLVAGGFLGDDPRPLEEIIEADAAALERMGVDPAAVAERMAELSRIARTGLGSFVKVDDTLEIAADDNRGVLVCPWADGARPFKTVTTARRTDTGQTVQWSDLSTHFIAEHGFFQGHGSAFRLDPRVLVDMLL
jgi:hypothetical protein